MPCTPLQRVTVDSGRHRPNATGGGVRPLLAAVLALAVACACVARAEHAYLVEPGDTLYALAARFGTTVAALRSANGLTGSLLTPGEVLKVPGSPRAGYHTTIAEAGETLADVAARVGRSVATLASANPVLVRSGVRAGAPVSVPPADGVTVEASGADSLATLAGKAGITVAELARLNGLDTKAQLQAGQPVLLPAGPASADGAGAVGAEPVSPLGTSVAPAPPVSVAASAAPAPAVTREHAPALSAVAASTAASPRTRLEKIQDAALLAAVARLPEVRLSTDSFVEPVRGRLSSRFGWRALSVDGNHFHAGIDLAVPVGTPVHAARDGEVVEARWDGTYGKAVFLDHGDGSQTRYAHLSRITVHDGERVRQGDVIGYSGSTGWSTGPHVHFELRFDGRAVDPLDYLRDPALQ